MARNSSTNDNNSSLVVDKTYISLKTSIFVADQGAIETLPPSEFTTAVNFKRRYFSDAVQSRSTDPAIGFAVHEPSQAFFVPFRGPDNFTKLTKILQTLLVCFGAFENIHWLESSPVLDYSNAVPLNGPEEAAARVSAFAAELIRAVESQDIRVNLKVTVERRIIAPPRFFEDPFGDSEEARERDFDALIRAIHRHWLEEEGEENRFINGVRDLIRVLDEISLAFVKLRQALISGRDSEGASLASVRRAESILIRFRVAIQLWLGESDQTLVRARDEYQSRLGLESRVLPEQTMLHLGFLILNESESDEDDSTPRRADKSAVEELKKLIFEDRSTALTCVICLEDVLIGCEITTMPCSHEFHTHCILKWLSKSYTCPICRYELPTDHNH